MRSSIDLWIKSERGEQGEQVRGRRHALNISFGSQVWNQSCSESCFQVFGIVFLGKFWRDEALTRSRHGAISSRTNACVIQARDFCFWRQLEFESEKVQGQVRFLYVVVGGGGWGALANVTTGYFHFKLGTGGDLLIMINA